MTLDYGTTASILCICLIGWLQLRHAKGNQMHDRARDGVLAFFTIGGELRATRRKLGAAEMSGQWSK